MKGRKTTILAFRSTGLLFAILLFCGSAAAGPPIEVPAELRHANYLDAAGRGSCGFAAAEDLLVAEGRPDEAAYWRAHFAGPTWIRDLPRKAQLRHLAWDATECGDEAWLQAASDLHLAAVIGWGTYQQRLLRGLVWIPGHAVLFLGFDADHAWYLDSNGPAGYRMRPRAEFLRLWRTAGGDGFTLIPTDRGLKPTATIGPSLRD
ncbi:MAG: hypothetical protein ABSG68_27000 [Thermoguttaceae bacterium]